MLLIALFSGVWSLRLQSDGATPNGVLSLLRQSDGATSKEKNAIATLMVSAVAEQRDVSVRLTANGTVSAIQTVEVRPQISATVNAVHIKEGQYVR